MGSAAGLMPQEVHTTMMAGGLDLATPPIVMPPGKVIASSNYEPDAAGYTSSGGYERFDGHIRPSDSTDAAVIANRRAAILAVPGEGPVRGVWVFDGYVYAFRDQGDGYSAMFRSSLSGWQQISFGYKLQFGLGEVAFTDGEYVTGSTSGATAQIDRVVVREGEWSTPTGTAAGFLIVKNVTGDFVNEVITSGSGGSATGLPLEQIRIINGGHYEFTNHNFYGSASRTRMYFCNGTDTAFEWSGTVMTPIHTGISGSGGVEPLNIVSLLAPEAPISAGETITALLEPANPSSEEQPIIMAALFDTPLFLNHYKNHLFLGYSSGSILNSSLGEPTEFNTTTGAGEIAFGDQLTGFLAAASSALVVFAQNRIEYLTGSDATTFLLSPITDTSGAQPYTLQMMDAPMFLDDGGVRSLPTTAAFGDWRLGSVTQLVEALIRQKRDQRIHAVASMRIKSKDQYKLFWDDGSGITVYIGRKHPETMPFKLPMQVYCACAGEVDMGSGDRLFVGGQDGYVYEMNRGTSYDGAAIDSYIRLPFNAAKSPSQHTRWMKAAFEVDTPDPITIGVAFDVDYARGDGGVATNVDVDAGSTIVTTDNWDAIDWTQPVEGRLEYHLAGVGPNIAATLIHSSAVARQHTISSQTYNFSRRRLKR